MHEVLLIDLTDPGSRKHSLNDNCSLSWFLLSEKDFFSQILTNPTLQKFQQLLGCPE